MIANKQLLDKIGLPPTRAGDLYGKHIRIDRLGTEEQEFFKHAFPRFVEEARDNPYRQTIEEFGFTCEVPFQLRRFSSGHALPRGRYYTDCTPDTAFSQQTLAMELLAYATVGRESVFDAFDVADPATTELLRHLDNDIQAQCKQYENRCIVVLEHPLRMDPKASHKPLALVLPYEITRISRKAIFDMRNRQAMQWLLHTLWEFFPGTLFMTLSEGAWEEMKSRSLGWGPLILKFSGDPKDLEDALEDQAKVEEFDIKNCGLGSIPSHDNPLFSLLQYILNPGLGGTPIDDIIAGLLISVGVDCLVYPSARHDCGVYYKGDRITGSLGWNIVDLMMQGSSPPRMETYLVDHLDYFRNLSGHLELIPHQDPRDPYDPPGWHLHGTAAETRKRVLRAAWQHKLEQECSDFPLHPNIIVERTAWQSYTHGTMYRKPRAFGSWFDLRLALITNEIKLNSHIFDARQVPVGMTVGEYIVALSQNHDLWGSGVTATYFDEDDPFLIQKEDDDVRLLCPACGDVAEFSLTRMSGCLSCGLRG